MPHPNVLDLFHASVRKYGTKIAIEDGGSKLTYADLSNHAGAIARWLFSSGVQPGARVAVCTNHVSSVVASMMAIWSISGIFVPIDPDLPILRKEIMAKVAEPEWTIVKSHSEITMAGHHDDVKMLALDDLPAEVQRDEKTFSSTGISADAPCYIYFSSGSTGEPKGIVGCMKGINHFIDWELKTLNLPPSCRVSQFTRPSFDAFLRDIFVALCRGGTVCVPPSSHVGAGGGRVIDWIDAAGLNLIHCVPSLFRSFLNEEPAPTQFSKLRYVLMAGEPLLPSDVYRWMSIFGDRIELINAYGPTETTMVKFFYFVKPSDANRRFIPIGKPMEGARAVLINEASLACVAGEVGEIYIRTPYRTLGYWNRPDLTRQVFVPNPFNPGDPNDVVYKTGDLARLLDSGDMEFLGRRDNQVKIRGVRVELSEVETVLRHHPSVSDVAVVKREYRNGEVYLCAYIATPESGQMNEIREYLAERLPSYMVPRCVRINAIPRLPNGKLDSHSIPDPDIAAAEAASAELPATTAELRMMAIWERVLGLSSLRLDDNFFELGGHSLLAPKVIAEMEAIYKIKIPLATLFEAPTVRGMAAALMKMEGKSSTAYKLPMVAPDRQNRNQPFLLTDVQEAYWVGRTGAFELGNVATHSYLEVEFEGLDLKRFVLGLRKLIDRHDMLRAIILPDGRQQILAEVPPYQIEIRDLRDRTPRETAFAMDDVRQEMSHQVLASDVWPLFHISATLLDGNRTRLHISYDLLISDAFSNRIMARELSKFMHDDFHLPPLELSFRDYVLAMNQLRDTEIHASALEYWRARLHHLPPAPELPLVKDPGKVTHPRFAHRIRRLDHQQWQGLKHRAAQAGLTPSGLLLAVFAEVLSTWSRLPHFCIDVTLYNRLPVHAEVDKIVGDFTSITLLEVDHRALGSFEKRARELQKQLWRDLDHRSVSGVEVIRQLTRRLGGSRKALYPVVFTSTLIHSSNHSQSSFVSEGKIVFRSSQTSQVWLDSIAEEEGGQAQLRWNAVEELLPSGLLDDMFKAYCSLIDDLSRGEEAWSQSTRLVPQYQLLQRAEINNTAGPFPNVMLHELFAARAATRGEVPAVITTNRTLSYCELQDAGAQLAAYLQSLAVKPGEAVAIVMQKGWEQIVAVMGTVRAGAAYLPISSALPEHRLRMLLEDGGVRVVLTQEEMRNRWQWPESLHIVCIDSFAGLFSEAQLVACPVTVEDLAYVLYTSGSTGKPKGVMIAHASVVNRVTDVNERFAVNASDRCLALTALHHDLSVYDIFGLLAAGGAIVIPDAGCELDPEHWIESMHRHQVTLWNSVPAFMEMLVEYVSSLREPRQAFPASLRLVMLSGDKIPVSLPDRIRALKPDVHVISLGGPTETTIWDICYPIQNVDPDWINIPYGKPMRNQKYDVLDDALRSRPAWVPGELYASGRGLAKGYWRDEQKTGEKFLQHPMTGERIYRTGDVGRYLGDGNIDIIGRADFQVKIQGWRIDLGEIESVLLQHDRVQSTAVMVADSSRGKRLLAYVVVKQNPEPDIPLEMDAADRLRFKLARMTGEQDDKQPFIQFGNGSAPENDLADYVQRRSYRVYDSGKISLEQFSSFLHCLSPVTVEGYPFSKYRYASAGGLYPVELYVYIKPGRIEELAGGIYRLDAKHNRLYSVNAHARIDTVRKSTHRALFEDSGFSLYLIADKGGINPVYGDSSRDFCLIEAGLMAQLLEENSARNGIGLCHVGGFQFNEVAGHFRISRQYEFLHALVGGCIQPVQRQREGFLKESAEFVEAVKLIQSPAAIEIETMNGTSGLPLQVSARSADPSLVQQELRNFLKDRLPEHMVPSTFVMLDSLPLNANGKVDRAALAAIPLGMEQQDVKPASVAPRDGIERDVAAIWSEILGVGNISIHDNFFDLGGNSLKLIRMHMRIKEALNCELAVADLFQFSTVHALAERLRDNFVEKAGPDLFERARNQSQVFARMKLGRAAEEK